MPDRLRLPELPSELPPVAVDVALRHELADSTARARLGGLFYAAGVVTVGLSADMQRLHPWIFAGGVLVFVVLALLRLRRPPTNPDPATARRWLAQLWVVIFLSTGLWGAGAAWVVATTDVETARVLALVLIGAFGTTLSHVYAMRIPHTATSIALLFVPQLALTLPTPGSRMLGISLLIYFVYLLLVLRRSNVEYWHRVALEVETRRQRDFYEQQSRRDGLTGLPNRRRFDAMLTAVLGRRSTAAADDAVSLILFDLDHFKAVNDRHGHAVGDRCLVHFAACLGNGFDDAKALPARLGGEEFGVILPGCGLAEASRLAELARIALADGTLLHDGIAIPLTVSGGVVSAQPDETVDSLLARADAALYEAKRSGRDRIVVGEPGKAASAPV